MQKTDEGYIKYILHWENIVLQHYESLNDLIFYRNKLFDLNLIGKYDNEISFGNISNRINNTEEFLISGTQTGGIKKLNSGNFSLVTNFDINKNELYCRGELKASSEALTHAAFYVADKNIHSVIHVHNENLWQKLLFNIPTVLENISYGTPELANEILKLMKKDNQLREKRILLTAGHREGIFTFGKDLKEAYDVLMKYFHETNNE